MLDLLDYECELRERERKLKKMNCKWAKGITLVHDKTRLSWICRSPHRDDMGCAHCCLDCSRPFHYDGEVLGCLGVCEAARSAVMGEEREPVGYWDATGCGRWVE